MAVGPVGAWGVGALGCAMCCAGTSSSSSWSASQSVEGKSGASRLCLWPSVWGQSPQHVVLRKQQVVLSPL